MSKTAPTRPCRRRNPRVPVEFSVTIEGRDQAGKNFSCSGAAVTLSAAGATVITEAQIPVGTRINLTLPFGRTLEAEINGCWIDRTDNRQRIGVKLLNGSTWFTP